MMDTYVAWTAIALLLLWLAAEGIVRALAWIDRGHAEVDAQIAADFGEPTRTEVEADLLWALFPAPEFVDTPIYQQMRHEEDVWFAASVMADIDDLPEVAS